jgi:hypothetical protein
MRVHQTNSEAQSNKENSTEEVTNPTVSFPENPHSEHQDDFNGPKICLDSVRFKAVKGTNMNPQHRESEQQDKADIWWRRYYSLEFRGRTCGD